MQNRLSRFIRHVGAGVLAAVLLGLAILYLLAGGFGAVFTLSLLGDWQAWYFPGDPALAEIAIMSEVVAFVAAIVAGTLLFSVGLLSSARARISFAASLGLVVAVASVPLMCIAHRHVGEWSRFRDFAWSYVDEARAQGLDGRQFDKPPEFRFAHWSEPVKLRAVSSQRWPTALVDFGNGGNAVFDLRTMWCTYSD
jgi:hypothetical protein